MDQPWAWVVSTSRQEVHGKAQPLASWEKTKLNRKEKRKGMELPLSFYLPPADRTQPGPGPIAPP